MLKKIMIGIVLFVFPLSFCFSTGNGRQMPLDMYVIIDGSEALQNARQDALGWFLEEIAGRILQDGDRLSVWIAGGRAELVFSDTLKGPESREALRERLGAVNFSGKTADFAGALREALGRSGGGQGSLPPYTLLIASSTGLSPSLEGSAGGLLRYSRVEEFSGWRALRVAADIGGRVREAAAVYLNSRN